MDCSAHKDLTVMEYFDEAIELSGDGKWAACRPMFYHLLEKHSDEIEEWSVRQFIGNTELYLENYEESIRQLNIAIAQGAESIDEMNFVLSHCDLGRALYCMDQCAESLEAYEKAGQHIRVLQVPAWAIDLYSFHLGRGRTRLRLSQFDAALEDFLRGEQVVLEMPDDGEKGLRANLFHYEIGRLHVYNGDWRSASERIERVDSSLLDKSHHSWYHNMMIRYHLLKKDFEQAWTAYEMYMESGVALSVSRSMAVDGYLAGFTLYHLGRNDEAKSHFEKALAIEDKREWVGEECEKYLALIKEADTGKQS